MKKTKAIIATIIFIALGLTVYAFANPNEEEVVENGNSTVKYNIDNEDDNNELLEEEVSEEENEEEENTTANNNTNNNNNNNNNQNTNENTNNQQQTEGSQDNSAVIALVEASENSLEKEDYDKALEEVNKLTSDKEELLERLDNVKTGIDTIALVDNLVKQVNESENKEDVNDAREYSSSNDVENKVEALTNESVKNTLKIKLTSIKPVLNDETDPVVNIENNSVLKTANINVTDDSNVNIYLTLNEVTNKIENNSNVTEDGIYSLKVVDKSFNVTNINFVIDNVNPTFNVVNGSHSKSNIDVVVTDDNFDYATIYLDGVESSTQTTNEFTLTSEGTYKIVAYDKAGNNNTLWTAIDTTLPVISGVEDGEYYNTNKTIVVTDKYLTKVIVNGTEYTRSNFTAGTNNENFTFELTLSEDNKYTVEAIDKVGNSTKVSFVVDKTAPVINLKGTVGLNKNELRIEAGTTITLDDIKANVTDNIDEDTIIEPYRVDFLIGAASENEYNYDFSNGLNTRRKGGRYNVYYKYTDQAGNKSEKTMLVVISDTTAPTITLKGTAGLNKNELRIEAGTTITLDDIKATVTDNADDTTTIEPYKVDFLIGAASENEYNYDFSSGLNTRRKGGRYNVYYKYTDQAGNKSEKTMLVVISDTTAPTITLKGTAGLNKNELRIEAGTTITLDDIKATVTDNADDTTTIEPYKVDYLLGAASENEYNYDFSSGLNTRRRGGRYNVYYKYTDQAGNTTEKTMLVVISDTTAPTITVKSTLGRNKNEMHVEAGTTITLDDIKATVTDNADDTTTIEPYKVDYLLGAASENEYNYDFSSGLNTVRKGGRYNVYYRYTDQAGNTTEKTMMVLISDTKAPEMTNGTTSTSHDTLPFTITLKFKEDVQETNGWTYGNDKSELKKTFSEETTETVVVKDLAGNITNVVLKTNRLKGDVVATLTDDDGNVTPYSNFMEVFMDL